MATDPTGWPARIERPGRKHVLAIDGGGMRGALALGILSVLEQRLREQSGDPRLRLAQRFDLIGGTSTGAILAAGLALGGEVAQLVDLYRIMGPRIFGRGFRMPGVQSMFDPRRLAKIIQDHFGPVTLGTAEWETGFAAVMKRVDTASPWLITNNPRARYWFGDPAASPTPATPARRVTPNRDYPLAQVILASAAAPFYFDAIPIEVEEGLPALFLDGGITPHNNPSLMLAMAAGVPAYGFGWTFGRDTLSVTSIGTGAPRPRRAVQQRRALAAWRAMVGLSSVLYDCSQHVLAMMQWLGHAPNAWPINGEVGTLAEARGTAPPMWTTLRYDAPLEAEWLATSLGLSFPPPRLAHLAKLHCHDEVETLFAIGAAAGERMIDPAHLA